MTDLDRKIAELKGWQHVDGPPESLLELIDDHGPGYHAPISLGTEYIPASRANWSTSDSKALELVDELDTQFFLERYGQPNWKWAAVFIYRTPGLPGPTFRAEGKTRPEAICRAYIAAREWMEKQGKGFDFEDRNGVRHINVGEQPTHLNPEPRTQAAG